MLDDSVSICAIFYISMVYGFFTQLSLTVVQLLCLVFNRDVAKKTKKHRAVQCDLCASWVNIACNNLNVYR